MSGHNAYDREQAQKLKERTRRGVSGSDVLIIRAEIHTIRGAADEYESFLVLRSGEKTWPHIYIPETLSVDVLEAVLAKLNA